MLAFLLVIANFISSRFGKALKAVTSLSGTNSKSYRNNGEVSHKTRKKKDFDETQAIMYSDSQQPPNQTQRQPCPTTTDPNKRSNMTATNGNFTRYQPSVSYSGNPFLNMNPNLINTRPFDHQSCGPEVSPSRTGKDSISCSETIAWISDRIKGYSPKAANGRKNLSGYAGQENLSGYPGQQNLSGYPGQENLSGYPGQQNPFGYAGQNPSGYAGQENLSGYPGQENLSCYPGQENLSGYPGQENPSGYPGQENPSGYAGQNPSGYAEAQSVSGYPVPQSVSMYAGPQNPSGQAKAQALKINKASKKNEESVCDRISQDRSGFMSQTGDDRSGYVSQTGDDRSGYVSQNVNGALTASVKQNGKTKTAVKGPQCQKKSGYAGHINSGQNHTRINYGQGGPAPPSGGLSGQSRPGLPSNCVQDTCDNFSLDSLRPDYVALNCQDFSDNCFAQSQAGYLDQVNQCYNLTFGNQNASGCGQSAQNPSGYGPSAQSPSGYGQSAQNPSGYGPSAQSPSGYGPSAQNPSGCAGQSAQNRSGYTGQNNQKNVGYIGMNSQRPNPQRPNPQAQAPAVTFASNSKTPPQRVTRLSAALGPANNAATMQNRGQMSSGAGAMAGSGQGRGLPFSCCPLPADGDITQKLKSQFRPSKVPSAYRYSGNSE